MLTITITDGGIEPRITKEDASIALIAYALDIIQEIQIAENSGEYLPTNHNLRQQLIAIKALMKITNIPIEFDV